jgi:UDP-N-acetylmuramate dehydrogenase
MNIEIKKNVDLSGKTTLKIGGRANFFVTINDEYSLREAVEYARENNFKIFILAGGSNVLISDKGFDGLVIKMENSQMDIVDETEINCGAGVNLMSLVNFSLENDLTGLEWAAGIPGTVGGAVRGNAGAFGGEIKDNLAEVKVLDLNDKDLKIKTLKRDECKFNYRSSFIKENDNLVIVSIKIKLNKNIDTDSQGLVAEIIKKRAAKQPTNPSAGSFFKNPVITDEEIIEKFEHDSETKMRGDRLPAGWFIEDLGLKGKKIGDAQVSEKHSNFIINAGKARAEDVIILSSLLKQKVRDNFGVQLEEEVSRIGF